MSQARLGVAAPGSMVHCLGAEGLAFLEGKVEHQPAGLML